MRAETVEAAVATLSTADAEAVRETLAAWCDEQWPGTRLRGVRGKVASGASSELLFLDVIGRQKGTQETLVLRLASRWPVYPVENLRQQGHCMTLVARALPDGLSVPNVEAVETRCLPGIERPFMVMSCVDGHAAPDQPSYVVDGWLHDLSDGQRQSLWRAGIGAIAAVHATPLTSEQRESLRLPVAGETALQQLLNYWSLFLHHVEQKGQYPTLQKSVAWLHQHAPDSTNAPAMVWGDASLRNILFDTNSPRVLLDFEFAHVGLRELDVAFYPLMDFVMAEGFAGGAPRLRGFGGMAESMDYYETLSGQPIRHRNYFLRMALTYMALSTTRVYQRLAMRGDIAPAAVEENPPLRLLREVISGQRCLPD